MFESEEEAKDFVKNWNTNGQLSTVGHGRLWYVCLPNIISEAVEHGIKETEKLLKLNVPLGYEWTVGQNWYQCH